MKKIIALLLLLAAMFTFVSCDDESEEATDDTASVTVYQENDNYKDVKMAKMRIGDTEWEDIEYKVYSSAKNVEPGSYIPEVWSQNEDQAEMTWNKYYYTDDQIDGNTKTFEAGKKYQVRLMNDGTVEMEEMLSK